MTTVTRRGANALTAVVLAAGGSSRLGVPKQLARHRGLPLLARAVHAAADATGRPVVVVIGPHPWRLRQLLRRSGTDAIAAANADWATGLSSSVRAGLRAVPAGTRAVLLMLTDQPLVDAASLRRLVRAWSRRPALPAAARYAGRVGVPAIVPQSLWPALRGLTGDEGARRVLHAAARITVVDMPEAAFDVDVPADLARLRFTCRTPS